VVPERHGLRGGPGRSSRSRTNREGRRHPLAVAKVRRLLASCSSGHRARAVSASASPELRRMGIRTVMITGDIDDRGGVAAEAGVDDFLRAGEPRINKNSFCAEQAKGQPWSAMCGDGTNDAPALCTSRR